MGAIDVQRILEAVEGTEPRTAFYVVVDDGPTDLAHPECPVDVSSNGVWLDCHRKDTDEPIRVRWGLLLLPGGRGGIWLPPPEPGEEIMAVCEDGNPLEATGMYVFATDEKNDAGLAAFEIPAEVLAEPKAIHVMGQTARVILSSATSIAQKAPLVELGADQLGPLDWIVHGSGIDPSTGLTYTALGNTSTVVKAKK